VVAPHDCNVGHDFSIGQSQPAIAQPDQSVPDGPLRAQQQPQPHHPIPQHDQQPVNPQLGHQLPAVQQLGHQEPAVPMAGHQRSAIPQLGHQQPTVPQLQQPGAQQSGNGAVQQNIMQVIYSIHDDMRRYINIMSLYPYLNKYEILIREERQVLTNQYTIETTKVDQLLEIIDSKSPSKQKDFLKAIKDASEHAGHREICKILRKKGLHI